MLGELTTDQIEDVLMSNVIGRLGCCAEQKMYVVPITYVYDGGFVIGHTEEGMKIDMLRQNPQCCFEVDVVKSISNWQSVIAWGTYEELKGEEADKASAILLQRLRPVIENRPNQPNRMGQSSSHPVSTQARNSIVYRIRLKEKTGRYEKL